MTLTKIAKVLNALTPGKELTVEQLEKKTGAVNVSAVVAQLRTEGWNIHTNLRGKKGNKYYAYRLSV